MWDEDYVDKPKTGLPYARILLNSNSTQKIKWHNHYSGLRKSVNPLENKQVELSPGWYDIEIDKVKISHSVRLENGGVYTVLITPVQDQFTISVITVTEPNNVHMAWLIPQIVALTLGEILLSVTGLEFSYDQAPMSMKSVIQSVWIFMHAIGNIIVIIIAKAHFFDSVAYEFLLFAALMFLTMILLAFLAYRYKPNDPTKPLAIK